MECQFVTDCILQMSLDRAMNEKTHTFLFEKHIRSPRIVGPYLNSTFIVPRNKFVSIVSYRHRHLVNVNDWTESIEIHHVNEYIFSF